RGRTPLLAAGTFFFFGNSGQIYDVSIRLVLLLLLVVRKAYGGQIVYVLNHRLIPASRRTERHGEQQCRLWCQPGSHGLLPPALALMERRVRAERRVGRQS